MNLKYKVHTVTGVFCCDHQWALEKSGKENEKRKSGKKALKEIVN